MKHKVYYGEYSLSHWIALMLKQDIVLPPYQRYFVWDEEATKRLLLSLKWRQFIPPVIIGSFDDGTNQQNLILDGQQRLTSVLLSALGVFPEKAKFNTPVRSFIDENDDPASVDGTPDVLCEWTFKELVKGKLAIDDIKAELDASKYKMVDYRVGGTFFDTTYLGFCYLIPENNDQGIQQRYYSTLFRYINFQGEELSAMESREALYFLDSSKTDFFRTNFIAGINQKSSRGLSHVDFVRFLALLSDYKTCNDFGKVAIRAGKRMEAYYEDYIYAVVNDDDSARFGKFSLLLPSDQLQQRMSNLEAAMQVLGMEGNTYASIIYLDIDFFGLVFHILFEGKELQEDKSVEVKNKLKVQADKFKKDKNHTKTPSAMIHLRNPHE